MGVNVREQLEAGEVPATSEHVVALNVPPPDWPKVTVPVGETLVTPAPVWLSVTVAVQVVAVPAVTELGEQVTDVVVVCDPNPTVRVGEVDAAWKLSATFDADTEYVSCNDAVTDTVHVATPTVVSARVQVEVVDVATASVHVVWSNDPEPE